MRVLRVLTSELGEELPELDLEIRRQRCREPIGLLQLDPSVARRIDLEHDIAEPLEVGIDVPVE